MPVQLRVVQGEFREGGDPIAALQAILRRYPQARVASEPGRVIVEPLDSDGFIVSFKDRRRGRYRVDCAGWHAEFADETLAVGCFTSALSPACRLEVWRRGGAPYRWELQSVRNGEWVSNGAVSNILVPFWRRPRQVVFLQNRLLEAA